VDEAVCAFTDGFISAASIREMAAYEKGPRAFPELLHFCPVPSKALISMVPSLLHVRCPPEDSQVLSWDLGEVEFKPGLFWVWRCALLAYQVSDPPETGTCLAHVGLP
jgi:hypothetical protein